MEKIILDEANKYIKTRYPKATEKQKKVIRQDFLSGAVFMQKLYGKSPEEMKAALFNICTMKRLEGEKDDHFAFNRCWHIATVLHDKIL